MSSTWMPGYDAWNAARKCGSSTRETLAKQAIVKRPVWMPRISETCCASSFSSASRLRTYGRIICPDDVSSTPFF